MITKLGDIHYCNVDKEKIKNAEPTLNEEVLKYHHLYITERTEIYKRKEVQKIPQPWTEDEVFAKYRFTNTRRELDRESKYLIEKVSLNDSLTLEEKIYNSMFFRTFNKSTTFDLIEFPNKNFNDVEKYRQAFLTKAQEDPKYVFFTSAFNCGGLKAANAMPNETDIYECTSSGKEVKITNGTETKQMTWREAKDYVKEDESYSIIGLEPNMPMRMLFLMKNAVNRDMALRIIQAKDQFEVFNILQEVKGFSRFLAYQVFVDLTYIPEFKFSENEFTISGPGCDAGLDLLFDDKDGMNYEEALFWVRDNIEAEWDKRDMSVNMEELFDFLPKEDRSLNVMMLENSFCECLKLTKSKRDQGRPRNKYKPTDKIETKIIDDW